MSDATAMHAAAIDEWDAMTDVPPTLLHMGVKQVQLVRELRDTKAELKVMTEDRDEYRQALREQRRVMRQEQLDHHTSEVRRLMGLPPKSPWRSQVVSEQDHEEWRTR